MKNNLDKSFSNNNDVYLNNSQYSYKKSNYLNDNNYLANKTNEQNILLINSCKNLAIVYIALWAFLVVFFIIIAPFFYSGFYVRHYVNNLNIYDVYVYNYHPYANCYTTSACVGSIIGLVLLILGILLAKKNAFLEEYYPNYIYKYLSGWFLPGIFMFGLPSFVGSVLTIVSCNNIKRQCFNDFVLASNSEYLSDATNKKNFLSVDICKWCSVSYIVLCLSLFILITVCSFLVSSSHKSSVLIHGPNDDLGYYYNNNYHYAFLSLIIGGSVFGIVLFILSIVLATQTMLLHKSYIHYVENFFIWFVFGIILIPSFIGSIITIARCKELQMNILNI